MYFFVLILVGQCDKMFGIYRIQCKEGNVGKPFHIIFKDIGLLGYLPNMKIIFYQHTNKNICWNPNGLWL